MNSLACQAVTIFILLALGLSAIAQHKAELPAASYEDSIALSPSGKWFAAVDNRDRALVWNVAKKELAWSVGHARPAKAMTFVDEEELMTLSWAGRGEFEEFSNVCYIDLKTGLITKTTRVKGNPCAISACARFVVTVLPPQNVAPVLYDLESGKAVALPSHKALLRHVGISPGGKYVATTCDDWIVKASSGADGKLLWEKQMPTNYRNFIFRSDNKTMVGEPWAACDVFVWDVETGKEKSAIANLREQRGAGRVTPNGRLFVTSFHIYFGLGPERAEENFLSFWSIDKAKRQRKISLLKPDDPWRPLTNFVFSKDGSTFAVTGRVEGLRGLSTRIYDMPKLDP